MTRGFSSLKRKLRRAQRKIPSTVEDSADNSLESIIRRSKRFIMMDDAVASGMLLNSFYKRKYGDRIEIGNNAPYAKYVEYGTGTYFGTSTWPVPPVISPYKAADFSPQLIAAIMEWARVKPSIQIRMDLREFAVAVAKEIDEKGTEPQPFFRPAVTRGIISLQIEANMDFSRELNRVFK